ncbi:MAG: lipid-binding SYLF domain-containing protein [Limnohabitans sp.]|jgi:lipid-binding SYLF domain-containing protein|nr:lipid-binding SYLF domain-containing protein [Limnohabitans sp.]
MQLVRIALILPLVFLAACSNSLSTRTGEALAIVRGFQSSDHPIPTAVFENAKGVAILREGSAAFVVGGSGGQGVFVKRAERGWSAPVAINTGGASIGLQAGAQSRDIIIVMNTTEEVANFLDDGMYGLAEASAVAGPAKTDPNNAGGPVPATYYYLRTEGLFGGLLVGGVYFSTADKINREQYGPDVSVGDITSGKVKAPAGSEILWKALN